MRVPRVGAQHKPVTEQHEINRAGLAGSCRPGRVGTDRTVPEARGGGSSEARLPRDKLPPPTREPSLWHELYAGRKTRVGRSPTAGVSASRHTWAGQRGLWGRRKPPNPADEGSTGSSTSEFGRKDSHLRRPLTPQQVSGKTPLAPGPRAERRGLAS